MNNFRDSAISIFKEASVKEMRILTDGFGNFVPSWCRPLFVWEVRLLIYLTEALDGFSCYMNQIRGSGGQKKVICLL